ncbi:MAG: c-type cytochrome [Acidimicrobiia bacterium]
MHLTPGGSVVALTIWENDLRHWLALVNVVFLVGLVGYLVWTQFFAKRGDESTPANRKQFLSDEDLEGRRLERVLGWSLLFVTMFAVVFLVYLVREPARQEESIEYFEDGSVERGATLFANASMPEYNGVLSLQCANCHGTEGGGGTTTQVIDSDGPDGPLPPTPYIWKVPPLNTVLLRFTPEEVADIITFGRPGTPMQAFGVRGGGAENVQTIQDLIAFLDTIQLSPEKSQSDAADALEAAEGQAAAQVTSAEEALASAEEALATAKTTLVEALGVPASTPDDELADDCNALAEELAGQPSVDEATVAQGRACRAFLDALSGLDDAEANLDWAVRWEAAREDVTDGQFLFELFCARCHTQGWSIFDPTVPDGTDVLGLAGGGGGSGGGSAFNLRDGATERRFGTGDAGFSLQQEFVSAGSEAQKQYGRGGIGTGRMPGFDVMLTEDMINAIVTFEREGLDDTSYDVPTGPGAVAEEE